MKYEYQFCCSAFCGFRFLDCGIFVRASFDQQKTWDKKTLINNFTCFAHFQHFPKQLEAGAHMTLKYG